MDCFLTPTTKAIKNQSASFFSPLLKKEFPLTKSKTYLSEYSTLSVSETKCSETPED